MAVINPYNYSKPIAGANFKMNLALSEQSEKVNNPISMQTQQKHSFHRQDKYLEQKVMSAKPEELVLMLYEGLIKFIKFSIMHLEEDNIQKVNESAQRAQAIVSELQSTLDMSIEISKQFDSLYTFVYTKLTQGNIKKDRKAFEEALEVSSLMLDMWSEMIKQMRA